jgi:hypothetical protein
MFHAHYSGESAIKLRDSMSCDSLLTFVHTTAHSGGVYDSGVMGYSGLDLTDSEPGDSKAIIALPPCTFI